MMTKLKTGNDLVKVARVMSLAKHYGADVEYTADRLYGADSHSKHVVDMMKDAVSGHGTTGTGSELYSQRGIATEFADAVRPLTALGKLQTTAVPLNVTLPFISTRTAFTFVAERNAIPVTAPAFGTNVTLDPKKIAGIVVTSKELLESSQGEAVLKRDMTTGVIDGLDSYLLDATAGDSARPAAINYDAIEHYSGGGATDPAGVDSLASAMIGSLITAGGDLRKAAFITTPANCLGLSLMRDSSSGVRAYPEIGVTGGVLAGLPIIAASAAPTTSLTLVDGSDILVGDDSGTEIRVTDSAMIDMDDSPAGNNRVSLFQADAIGLKVIRFVNWQMRRGFCVYATGFNLTPATVSTV